MLTHRVLKTYIEDVDKKFEEINEAFKKSVSKNAVEELSKIKMEDFKVANNLGIKNYQTVSSPMTGERLIEYDKKEIGLSDFMGIYGDRVGSYAEEFALVFEEQYKGAETADVRDYLREYYKAGEFDYKMYQPEKQMWSDVADIVSLGILPLGEALFGWNSITGESLTDTERGSKMLAGIVSLIPVGAAIKTVGKGGKLLLKTTAKLYVSECVTGLSMYGANYAGEKAGLPPELQAVLSFTAGATVAKISSDALFKPGGLGIIDDVAKGASGAKSLFDKGKDVFKKFNLNDAYVKPKHLSTSGGNGAKFLGTSKVESEVILREGLKNGAIKTITDNGITKLGSQSYEIIVDAGKVVGTKGETLIKVVLSEDGGMLSAYPVK